MASLYETAARLHDPRVKGRSKHLLADIVILAVLAVTSGAESYEAIEEFGRFHYQTLKKRLRLPNGIPSHDTINRVFQAIRFRQFERLFLEWAEGLRPEGATEKVIAIDGKTVRGSRDGYHDNPAIHLVHAWSVENGICLGQRKTRDKSNEITAIPELLDMLCVEGSIITIDAMGTQTAIAENSRRRGGLHTCPQGQPGHAAAGCGTDGERSGTGVRVGGGGQGPRPCGDPLLQGVRAYGMDTPEP